jgi:pyrroloquinoline-quinone synthase
VTAPPWPGASADPQSPLPPDAFVERLRAEGAARYHDHHPFHVAMHEGRLSGEDLARWVLNRYYYQTRIPIKDALIVSKSEDPGFRRAWVRRIHDHDGLGPSDGGLAQWLRLAEAVGLNAAEVATCRNVLPGVRFACDGYVSLVRESSLVVAVASSLTEFFAPDLMSKRIAAWEQHYPFVDAAGLAYFRSRVPRARRDSDEAVAFVVAHARTRAEQEACVAALIRKTEVLWHLLDCVSAGAGAEAEARAFAAPVTPAKAPGA